VDPGILKIFSILFIFNEKTVKKFLKNVTGFKVFGVSLLLTGHGLGNKIVITTNIVPNFILTQICHAILFSFILFFWEGVQLSIYP
jgi:hypothetical protein